MNKKISTFVLAAMFAIFAFSAAPAYAGCGSSKCAKHEKHAEHEKHVEKKQCKKGCTKPCCAKKVMLEKKCTKGKGKSKPYHSDNSRYND